VTALWSAAAVLLGARLASAADAVDGFDAVPPGLVPEPDTLALVGATVAIIALIVLFRRKRRGK
jgi:hypothetical protein